MTEYQPLDGSQLGFWVDAGEPVGQQPIDIGAFFRDEIKASRDSSGALFVGTSIVEEGETMVLVYAEPEDTEGGNPYSYIIIWPGQGDKLGAEAIILTEKDGEIEIHKVGSKKKIKFPTKERVNTDSYLDRLVEELDSIRESRAGERIGLSSMQKHVGDVSKLANRVEL